jgi:PEP-CTERM motif
VAVIQQSVLTRNRFAGFPQGTRAESVWADLNSGNIYEFTPGGTPGTFASGLGGPVGLAFNSAGDLFEADVFSGSLNEFTPGGTQNTFASGLNRPVALAFQPVPEPSVFGLLAVGASALFIHRRRLAI